MNIKDQQSPSRWESFQYWFVSLTLFGGLLLSIVSALNLCTQQCSETKSYLFFDLPFAYFGLAFFTIALIMQLLTRKYPFLSKLIGLMVVGSLGAEVMFIWIQKYKIGLWCPVCLSIATTVVLAAITLATGLIIQEQKRGHIMKAIKNILASLPVAFIGFFIALIGISKPDYALSAVNDIKKKIEFGNTQSPIEVYFVTDWFCPICKELEPQISKFAPIIWQKAGFFFVDMAVHPETENYSPYNLDFLANSKSNYIEIRKTLNKLAQETKTPDDEIIRKAIAPVGGKLHELSYTDIKAGLNFFEEIADRYDIHGTPEMIIVNTKTNEIRRLKGATEITEANILDAIKALQK